MTQTNETVLMAGFTTFINVNLKDVATLLTHEVGSKRAEAARKNLGQNGHAVLTNLRFVFGKGKRLKKVSVGEPADFTEALAKGDIVFDIALDEMISVTKGKQGFSTTLNIDTDDGTYKFAFMKKAKFALWEDAINKALSALGQA